MSELADQNPISMLESPLLDKSGKAITPRIKDAKSARSIHRSRWEADAANRLVRAWVQGILEGKPPFDPIAMKQAGLSGCANLDFRDGQLAIRKKMVPYVEALNSLPTFLRIKTKYGSAQDRERWGGIISAKHKKLFTQWDAFIFRYLYTVLYTASHGYSFAFFDNKSDWRWNVSSPGDMVVSRLSRADATEFDVISTIKDYQPHELYDYIRDQKKKAKWTDGDEGWHVPTVRRMIMSASSSMKDFTRPNDWELNERLIKNNELYFSCAAHVCKAIVMLAMETDGSVTQFILAREQKDAVLDEGRDDEQFLYKETSRYNSMKEAVIVFARDIGTNGDFHSIRGTGSDIYPMVQKLNELKCGAIDAAEVAAAIPISASEDVLSGELAYTKSGPFLILDDRVKMLDRQTPNYSNSLMPIMDMLQKGFMEQQGENFQARNQKPSQDIEGLLDALSGIDVMESTLWHLRWEMLLQQSLRRLISIKSSAEPGGKQAYQFRKWCMDEGVPAQAIDEIIWDECEAVKPIGNGSPQAKLFAMEKLISVVYPQLDEQGRRNATRDYICSLPTLDASHADRYAPEEPNMRPGVEVKIAQMENQLLMNGGQIDPLPDEPHLSHVEQHLQPMIQIQQTVEAGQATEGDAIPKLMPLYMHAVSHIQMAGEDPSQKARLGEIRKALHNMGEIIVNGQRQLAAEQRKAQEQGGQPQVDANGQPVQGTPQDNGVTAKDQIDLLKAQINLNMAEQGSVQAQQIHELKMQQEQEKLNAQRQAIKLKDITTAAQLQSKA